MDDFFAQRIVEELLAICFILVVVGAFIICVMGTLLSSIRNAIEDLAGVERGEDRRVAYKRRKEDKEEDA